MSKEATMLRSKDNSKEKAKEASQNTKAHKDPTMIPIRGKYLLERFKYSSEWSVEGGQGILVKNIIAVKNILISFFIVVLVG
jgi:hypothetical protein